MPSEDQAGHLRTCCLRHGLRDREAFPRPGEALGLDEQKDPRTQTQKRAQWEPASPSWFSALTLRPGRWLGGLPNLLAQRALGLVLGHPFDTVKVRLQTQNTYRGIIDCTVKTYRHESILGFFKGMSFPIASIAVVNSVLFGVYSNTLLVLTATSHHERRLQPPSYTHVFVAGCTGGFLQAYCLAPFDLIKVRLQNQTEPRARQGGPPPRYRGPVHCAASIFQEEGPRGLFRGAWALTLRDTPTLGIYFVSYEWLCRQVTPDGQNPRGFAGITSWVTATPLDVIKSRMQMAGLGQREYQGLLDCMVSSARQEGLGVFFRGLTINSARAFPVNAVTFLSYEYLLHLWG
ncbi:solute carrier family 25 member 45 isoform X2 [Myotis lucifugus]|uniref:solute carrier family 25 member 45 isoform X2 n=1 Tax=Myotis lucifugus TaxID=59463 RepID=UPI000CCBF4BA|nr:solute carrier family 25 member 45 isoform X2 [Myotis lucifugus]